MSDLGKTPTNQLDAKLRPLITASMRELGGMRRLVDDDVKARLKRMEQRGLTVRWVDSVDELTSRKDSTDIAEVLAGD